MESRKEEFVFCEQGEQKHRMEDEITFYAFYCIGKRVTMVDRIYMGLEGFQTVSIRRHTLHFYAGKELSSPLTFNIHIPDD